MTYDIIVQFSIRSAAALCRPRCGSGLAATSLVLLSLEPLGPDPLHLGDRQHPGVAPAVAPDPEVHLVNPVAVAPAPLRVGGGVSNTLIVLEAVWDSTVTLPSEGRA
jgi:hypothetical protein